MFWKRKKQAEPKPEKKSDPYDALADMDFDSQQAAVSYIAENAVKVNPPTPDGAAMDGCDTSPAPLPPVAFQYDRVNPVVLAHYVSNGFIGYDAMAIIAQHWLVRKGCELKPRDAARKWYDIALSDGSELSPESVRAIERLDRRYKLKQNVIEGLTFNNIFGIRHIWFKHKNPDFDYSKPFNPDEFKDGGYAGIAQMDPMRCIPVFNNEDLSDPRSINYLEPTWWEVNGTQIHRSHMVILKGDHVPDRLKAEYRYGGISKVQKVFQRVFAAEKTANEGPKLAMTKRLTWREADLEKAVKQPSMIKKTMQKITEMRDNYGVHLIGKGEQMGQLDTNLADLDSTIMTQYQLVCSIFDEPASKLLGTGHQGFSTGDADIDYRIESLEELQHNEMTDIVTAHYRRLIPSAGRAIGIDTDAEVVPDWRPIKVLSDKERAEINFTNRQADKLAYEMQAVDNYDIRERLINDQFSGYEGLEMPSEDDTALDEMDVIDIALDEIAGEAEDAEYQGRKVELNRPFRDSGGSGKFGVYVKNDKGNVVKVSFGDKDMEIKRDDPEARKNFRARHNCSEKTDKTKAGWWSCKFWSSKSVSELLGD